MQHYIHQLVVFPPVSKNDKGSVESEVARHGNHNTLLKDVHMLHKGLLGRLPGLVIILCGFISPSDPFHIKQNHLIHY